MKRISGIKTTLCVVYASVAIGWLASEIGPAGRAQSPPPSLPPGVGEVVKLAQAKMNDDVILAYVKNAGISCSLSADQIVYLSGQGVSQSVIGALLQSKPASAAAPAPAAVNQAPAAPVINAPLLSMPAPSAPPPVVAPPPPPVAAPQINFDYFHDQLAPSGAWVQIAGSGWCWRPNEAMVNPDWRPYCDRGRWIYSDSGWFWQSDYPWGDIVFHYGRWQHNVMYGWVWVPDYTWAPAWVCWRHTEGYCGWAPLPPGARFEAGIGLVFNGRTGVELDFGLRGEHFTFVAYDNFWTHDYRPYLVPRERMAIVFRDSRIMNTYRFEGNRVIVEGLGREHIARYTHRNVEVVVVPRERVVEKRVVETRVIERGGGETHAAGAAPSTTSSSSAATPASSASRTAAPATTSPNRTGPLPASSKTTTSQSRTNQAGPKK